MDLEGLFVVGRFVGIEQVRFGKNHPTRAGEVVDGLFKLKVATRLPSGQERSVEVSFSETDQDTGYRTPIAQKLDAEPLTADDVVAVRVQVRELDPRWGPRFGALDYAVIDGSTATPLAAVS